MLYEIGKHRNEGVPVSDVEVVAESWEPTGRVPPSVSTGALGALRVLRISWILNFCPSTLPLLRLVRGIFALLLRLRSISPVTLESLSKGHGDRHRSTHLAKSSSAVLLDSSRFSAFLPWITALSSSHTLKQYSASWTESLSSINFSCWVIGESLRVDAEWEH